MTTTQTSTARLAADDLERQLAHWLGAATTFLDAEEFASICRFPEHAAR